ncbi:MAG TPA: sigma-70 family RNA polymerase sigma factor [Pirellulaceae bacterium]
MGSGEESLQGPVSPPQADVTTLLNDAGHGDRQAWNALMPLVYDELRRIAGSQMCHESSGHTLQPTALVHEAYVRLAGQKAANWPNRVYFFGAAATVMRRILVDHVRARRAAKRGGSAGRNPTALDDVVVSFEDRGTDLLDLDEALQRLSTFDPDHGRIVELRFFGGLTVEETAAVMDVSASTVERGWRLARAWLLHELEK